MKCPLLLPILFLIPNAELRSEATVPPEPTPSIFQKRATPETRLAAIAELNGHPATQLAVTDSLRYLATTQNEDGSWNNVTVASTATAILCFLGNGESTKSAEFGPTIQKGITFLVSNAVANRGKLTQDALDHRWPYEHAIAVQALAEAYIICEKGGEAKIPNLKRAVEVCGQFLINSQHKGGGWDYAYRQDSMRGGDTSITGWHLQALMACKLTGLEFANLRKCYKKGLDYLERMQAPSGAFGYSSPNGLHHDGTSLTAIGALCFQTWETPADRRARKAIRFLHKGLKFAWDSPNGDLYAHFFASQAMRNHGGKEWARYHDLVFLEIIKHQAVDGSYLRPNPGEPKKVNASNPLYLKDDAFGKHYRTCLATLILQSYYR